MISTTEEGWRVRSAHNPSRYYSVSGNGDGLRCTCPDFENHAGDDPDWTCKHVLAVEDYQSKRESAAGTGNGTKQERTEIQERRPGAAEPQNGKSALAQMVIKRSLSPDARIDSISIEFSSPVDETTIAQVKDRALKSLTLQTEIVKSFLNSADGKTNGKTNGTPAKANRAITARLLDVGVANGQHVTICLRKKEKWRSWSGKD